MPCAVTPGNALIGRSSRQGPLVQGSVGRGEVTGTGCAEVDLLVVKDTEGADCAVVSSRDDMLAIPRPGQTGDCLVMWLAGSGNALCRKVPDIFSGCFGYPYFFAQWPTTARHRATNFSSSADRGRLVWAGQSGGMPGT